MPSDCVTIISKGFQFPSPFGKLFRILKNNLKRHKQTNDKNERWNIVKNYIKNPIARFEKNICEFTIQEMDRKWIWKTHYVYCVAIRNKKNQIYIRIQLKMNSEMVIETIVTTIAHKIWNRTHFLCVFAIFQRIQRWKAMKMEGGDFGIFALCPIKQLFKKIIVLRPKSSYSRKSCIFLKKTFFFQNFIDFMNIEPQHSVISFRPMITI